MTRKLFYDNPYQVEFCAGIVEIEKDGKYWRLVLDQTCFYPEGGGQPADQGWLNQIAVTDVQSGEEGRIYHYVLQKPEGTKVEGKINWHRRKDFMQQHSGQHIISGSLWQVGKFKTISVHMGEEYTTIEIEAAEISAQQLQQVEAMANGVINQNLLLNSLTTTSQEVDKFPLRKPCPVEGEIRVAQVENFDCVVCCGLHVQHTGEVELVKVVAMERIRGNVRLTWMIGERAFKDYGLKDQIVSKLQALLSTHKENLIETVERLNQEMLAQKRQASDLETRVAVSMADHLLAAAEKIESSKYILLLHAWHGEENSLVKKIIKQLLNAHDVIFCLVNRQKDKLQWAIGCSQNIDLDFNTIKQKVLPVVDGKGGGSFPLWQGVGKNIQGSEELLAAFKSLSTSLFR